MNSTLRSQVMKRDELKWCDVTGKIITQQALKKTLLRQTSIPFRICGDAFQTCFFSTIRILPLSNWTTYKRICEERETERKREREREREREARGEQRFNGRRARVYVPCQVLTTLVVSTIYKPPPFVATFLAQRTDKTVVGIDYVCWQACPSSVVVFYGVLTYLFYAQHSHWSWCFRRSETREKRRKEVKMCTPK